MEMDTFSELEKGIKAILLFSDGVTNTHTHIRYVAILTFSLAHSTQPKNERSS
jgi:hypothetical protein